MSDTAEVCQEAAVILPDGSVIKGLRHATIIRVAFTMTGQWRTRKPTP
jgi:hypothetical protein